MKELSIQEKAKRYDKALKRTQEWYDANTNEGYRGIFEDIFQELKDTKDSEDDKIRKVLIDLVKCNERSGYKLFNNIPTSSMIAWLEKQSVHKPYEQRKECDDCQFNYAGECKGYCYLKRNEQQSTYSEEDENIRKELTEFLNDASGGFLNSTIRCKTFRKWATWLEKQGEQKPTNKVEPKFKVGNIIKPKDGGHEPWQIMQVDMFDKKYRFKDGCVVHFSQEDDYELIEQNSIDNIEPKFKYGDRVRNKISGLEQTLGSCIGDIYEGAFPFFIKDQDDWELVKQNPTNKNDLKKIDTFCQENCKGYQETGRCFFDEECKAKKEYMKQKHTEWNEEDDGFLNLLLAIFNNSHPDGIFTTGDIAVFNGACITSNKIINWLKSIKDRAQSKQVWSQDDKDYYDAIITKLEVTQDDAMLSDNQMEFLKSLKNKI